MTCAPGAIRFDGRTAVVTGAGGGMGRIFALDLARRGACVLVNDAGVDPRGGGGSPDRAAAVAEEITKAGGRAAADAHFVGGADDARAMIDAARRAFGRVDILINNAGASASGGLDDHDDAEVERAIATNLLGPFHLMRAVWPEMRARNYGRILNISSSAALGGGFNAPYAAGKAGLIGLSLAAATEGAQCGVNINVVLPSAYSRMIELAPDRDFVSWFRDNLPPEDVSAAVLCLLAEHSTVNGCMFSVGGGKLSRLSVFENEGLFDEALTPEIVRERLSQALAMDGPVQLIEQGPDLLRSIAKRKPWTGAGEGPGFDVAALRRRP